CRRACPRRRPRRAPRRRRCPPAWSCRSSFPRTARRARSSSASSSNVRTESGPRQGRRSNLDPVPVDRPGAGDYRPLVMNTRTLTASLAAALISAAALAGIASAQVAGNNGFDLSGGGSSFAPRVPVSEFPHPASWLDPSRLPLPPPVSGGTGFGGGTDGLQVTSLSYQLANPLAVRVSL